MAVISNNKNTSPSKSEAHPKNPGEPAASKPATNGKMTPLKALQTSAIRQRGLYSTPGQAVVEARWLPLSMIVENPEQVRQDFEPEQLQELANDIAERGVLEPILVRALDERGEKFQIVAGARRYRASLMVGKEEIPVIIKEVTAKEARAIMLVENLQRKDLTEAEEQRYFQMLQAEENLAIKDIARLINRSEWYVRTRLQENPTKSKKPLKQGGAGTSQEEANSDGSSSRANVPTGQIFGAPAARKIVFQNRPLKGFVEYLDSVSDYLELNPPAEDRQKLRERLELVTQQLQKLQLALED